MKLGTCYIRSLPASLISPKHKWDTAVWEIITVVIFFFFSFFSFFTQVITEEIKFLFETHYSKIYATYLEIQMWFVISGMQFSLEKTICS